MTASQDLIWTLDKDRAHLTFYQQTLGLQYDLKSFQSFEAFIDALKQSKAPPQLLIADPETTGGSFMEAIRKNRETGKSLQFPEYMIASRIDDLEFMRFYLKAGARDYILKPLRPNELVAKVERALANISNQEIFILRNDLDGMAVGDLTFREHQMLTIFLSRPNRAVRRDDLYGAIWSKVTVNKKTLDVHLFNLRRKLRPFGYDIVCEDQIFSLQKQ